jgi:hypothetical protein
MIASSMDANNSRDARNLGKKHQKKLQQQKGRRQHQRLDTLATSSKNNSSSADANCAATPKQSICPEFCKLAAA